MKTLGLSVAVLLLSCSVAFCQSQYKVIYSFAGSPDGAFPVSELVADAAGNLYGTTESGGNDIGNCYPGCGTVFELSPAGGSWIETVLYSFCYDQICSDGSGPEAGLVLDAAGNLYGTAGRGGGGNCEFGCGTLFELSPPSSPGAEWTYTVLYQFCLAGGDNDCPDGANPFSRLTLDASGNLYGTTSAGGAGGPGTVFELSHGQNGWSEVVLYKFCAGGFPCPDGAAPMAGVTFDKQGNLYGTTRDGGTRSGNGVVYRLTHGQTKWHEIVLYAPTQPEGATLLGATSFDSEGNLYSTYERRGGGSGLGGVFQLSRKYGGVERSLYFDGPNGAGPVSGVLIDPKTGYLYGTTSGYGYDNLGTVYQIAGRKLTVLHHFTSDEDGISPQASLIEDAQGNLYGTATGDAFHNGTVFEITP